MTAPPTAPARRGRVLIVDDDISLLRLFRRMLEGGAFEVVTAENGKEALAKVQAGRFDVILSDIVMADMSGLELLRAVRQRDLDVPVLLMTGGPDVSTAVEAVECGALRYMLKPLNAAELTKAVADASHVHDMARLRREALQRADTDSRRFGDRESLEGSLANALESMWMAYQPVVSWSQKSAAAYEALLRSSDQVLTHPGAILEAAERLGRLNDVGRAVRARVARAVVDAPTRDIYVNLHSQDLLDDELHDPNAPLSLTASRIVLEITERASLEGVSGVSERIANLRRLGYRIAIDDLGAGYAGLTSFALLHPEVVKIDMSLVRGIEASSTKQRVVASLIRLCREMEMAMVCEGVETAPEQEVLTRLGCDLLQGYLFGRPAAEFPPPRFG